VVADPALVAVLRVPAALGAAARRRAAAGRQAGGAHGGEQQPGAVGGRDRAGLPVVDEAHDLVDVVHLQQPGDVRAAEAELPRVAQDVGQRLGRARGEARTGPGGGRQHAPVPQLDLERPVRERAGERREQPARGRRGAGRGGGGALLRGAHGRGDLRGRGAVAGRLRGTGFRGVAGRAGSVERTANDGIRRCGPPRCGRQLGQWVSHPDAPTPKGNMRALRPSTAVPAIAPAPVGHEILESRPPSTACSSSPAGSSTSRRPSPCATSSTAPPRPGSSASCSTSPT
jgi:hypothetical protein